MRRFFQMALCNLLIFSNVSLCAAADPSTINVGAIFSRSGTMMGSEEPLLAATEAAIKRLNESGGVLGKRIVLHVRDGASDPQQAARQARQLIDNERVDAIFGCWTSACRKEVMGVIEEKKSALFYPVQYEGRGKGDLPLDPSPRVVYSGAAPNQQLGPAVAWALSQIPKARVFLIGSDYVFPISANALIKKLVGRLGGSIVGEEYQSLGKANFSGLERWLEDSKPDIILNTVNGLDNSSLFDALSRLDPGGKKYLTISFSVEETQIREIGAGKFVGQYAAWNYFHDPRLIREDSLRRSDNPLFLAGSLTSDPVEAAYVQVQIFADAVRRAKSSSADAVLRAAKGLVVPGFRDVLRVDPENQHLWKRAEIRRFGEIRAFESVWTSGYPIRPDPDPDYETDLSGLAAVTQVTTELKARTLIASTSPSDRIAGLLFFVGNRDADLPLGVLGDTLAKTENWAEQSVIVHLFARSPRGEAGVELERALRLSPDPNFKTLVLYELAQSQKRQPPSQQLLETIAQSFSATADPVMRKAAIAAARTLDATSGVILSLINESPTSEPSVAYELLELVQQQPRFAPVLVSSLDAIVLRPDVSSAPGLAAKLCQTLALIGSKFMEDAPRDAANSYIRVASALPKGSDVPACKDVVRFADVLDSRRMLSQIYEFVPQSTIGWITLFAALIGLYKLIQGVVLLVAPGWAMSNFRPFGPVPVLPPVLSEYVKILDFTRHLGASNYCIDAWLRANRQWMNGCSEPDGPKLSYQPLEITDRRDGRETFEVPYDAYFGRLLADHSNRASIVGEGGVGKTAFAVALLRAANKPSVVKQEMLGILLPSSSIYALDSMDSLLSAIQQRLSSALRKRPRGWPRFSDKVETDELQFVKTLLSKGKIVLVLDDLPRYVDDTWQLPAKPDFNQLFRNFFYTGRTAVLNLGRTIHPRPIDRTDLLGFVSSYVALSSGTPLTASERQDLNDGIHGLFAARGADAAVPVLFGQLVGDAILAWRGTGKRVTDLTLTVPNLVLEYIKLKLDALPPQELCGITSDQYWKAAGCLAWECLGKTLKVSAVSPENAAIALKEYGDGGAIVSSLCLSDIAHSTAAERVVIGSDALAEYLAALWIFNASDPKRWDVVRPAIENALEQSRTQSSLTPNARSFLSALLDVAESSGGDGRYGLSQTSASNVAIRTIRGWLTIGDLATGEIVVGVLYSMSGHMAISERPVFEATMLAIDRINARGGICGHRLVPVQLDGASDPARFAESASSLIEKGAVCIFGCWTSASRIEVLKVLEKKGGLLFYPVQYEGYETHPNALYFGAAPNQQLLPAIDWCVKHLKARSFMLVGSDYVFPRVANEIMLESLKQKAAGGVSVVGDPLYVPLEKWSFDDVVTEIRRAVPDVILNTINGAANLEFFWNVWRLKREHGNSKLDDLKVMSFSLGDHEVQRIGVEIVKGHYAAWNYFASLDSQANDTFLRSMRVTKHIFFPSDPAESAFVQVQAFAKAASALLEQDQRLEWQKLRKAVLGVEIEAPSGRVTVDPATGHVSKMPRIGTVTEDGSFAVIWTSDHTVEPNPYPFPDLAERIQSIRAQLHGTRGVSN